ncbi:MAG TPA: PAS domain-containing protein, partial [Thermodesulfovibrionales bacterium]|nr:PAS domain-containing protein [Thermodesulfovibrionales bacterium]
MGREIKSRLFLSPFRLLVIAAVSFLASQVLVVHSFHRLLLPMPFLVEVVFDSFFLTILSFLILYIFLFRPMMLHINERKQAEENATQAYLEMDQIFRTAADGMRVVDKDFNILKANETFARMSGFD